MKDRHRHWYRATCDGVCHLKSVRGCHRDGKQHLDMGDCQIRNGEGQTRHMYLVFLAYSPVMSQLQHDQAQEWSHVRLTTIGESCRAMLRETLGKTLEWAIQRCMATSG